MGKKKFKIEGEPVEVTEIREKILSEFKDLTFVEEGHKYYLNGKELPSVSGITHKFCQYPFHEREQAEAYALKNGETPEYWLDKWKYNNLRATTTGTQVHSFLESYGWMKNGHPELITEDHKYQYIKDKNWLIPTRPKEEAGIKFFDELHKDLHFVLAETKVYSNKSEASNVSQQYCGTFDLLMYYKNPDDDSKSGLVIMDWKTNAELRKEYSRTHGKMLLPPFDGKYYEEPLSYYVLQLNLYALCLHGIGLSPVGLRVIWLKPDGTYELIPVEQMYHTEQFKSLF